MFSQAEQFLYTATAEIPSVERSIGESEDALNLLLGSAPTEVPRGKKLDQITSAPELPAGLPSSLLERRPDIRQAEENLIAANAQIGAARALFFPQSRSPGSYGSQSRALAAMFTGPARPGQYRTVRYRPDLSTPVCEPACNSPKHRSARCWSPIRKPFMARCAKSPTP